MFDPKNYLPGIILCFSLLFAGNGQAAMIEFHFTGQLTILDASGTSYGQAPIDSIFTYDTAGGIGSGQLFIAPTNAFFGLDLTIYDISMQKVDEGNGNLILGNMLVDYGVTSGIPLSTVWDATGLMNAIDLGLQVGDVISGTNLNRDGAFYADVGSATPASDINVPALNQGPAPLATTMWNTTTLCTPGVDCMGNAFSGGIGFTDDGIAGSPLIDGPFAGLQISLDIGSGNSLTVLNVSAVPVPAAAWLFISGFAGLLAVARRRKS